MEVKKYEKIILDSSRSIDDIVASVKAELSKQESKNAGESYICYVSHAYSSGENAGANYIVVSDGFKELKRLSSNVIQISAYNKDEINELIATNINTKANANSVVNLTDNQTIEGIKTFSSVPVVATQPTNDNQVVNKAYVDSKSSELNSRIDGVNSSLTNSINAKANSNAVVGLSGNQTIAGVKTFSSPIVVPNGTANNHAVNLAQLNTKANANATVNLSGNQTIAGVKTFSALPVCNILPTVDTQLANRNYVKKRGGLVGINGGAINLNNGINFSLNLTTATNITVANTAANIGQTGEIFVTNGANIRGFNAPFNFRVAQSHFGANEVFSYLVVSANLVRITRS